MTNKKHVYIKKDKLLLNTMCAGYNDQLFYDNCFIQDQRGIYENPGKYQLNLNANMRTNVKEAPLLTRGSQPSFYGPNNTSLVHKESLLQGRSQPLSKCPTTDVRYLPNSEFPSTSFANRGCYASALEPMFDQQPRSCQSVSEVDRSGYMMFPGAREKPYAGINDVAPSYVQSRMAILEDQNQACVRKQNNNASYGNYAPSYYYV